MLIKIYILSIILFLVFGELTVLRATSIVGKKNKKEKKNYVGKFHNLHKKFRSFNGASNKYNFCNYICGYVFLCK